MLTRYQGFTIISSLILILIVLFLLSLSVWQWSRMVEKEKQLSEISAVNTKEMLTLEQTFDQKGAPKSGTRVLLNGKVEREIVWLLDNQINEGRIGYKVLAYISTNKGRFLTDFGWVKGNIDRSVFPVIDLPMELREATAIVSYPNSNRFIDNQYIESKKSKGITFNRIQEIELDDSLSLLTLVDESSEFVRYWIPVVMPPEKHLAYAIQWLGLAIAAAVIGFVALRKKRK